MIGTWLGVALAVAIFVVLGIVVGTEFSSQRAAADACWAAGGVPVQGDSVRGQAVVCLGSTVVIEVSP